MRKRDDRAVTPFMEREGYTPERFFNSIHGAQRLNFAHAGGGWTGSDQQLLTKTPGLVHLVVGAGEYQLV